MKKIVSTGNDIISLKAINFSRTIDHRFYSKIITEPEVALYRQHSSHLLLGEFIWLLWSIKEASYKYLQRLSPSLVFSPTKFLVKQLQFPEDKGINCLMTTETEGMGFNNLPVIKGLVTNGDHVLCSLSLICKEFIHSVVNRDDNFDETGWGIKLIDGPSPKNQSTQVRAYLLSRLNSVYDTEDLIISKSPEGFPVMLKGTEELVFVSLSHHDCWVAYSFQS